MDAAAVTAKKYREHAEVLRAIADGMTDADNRRVVRSIADNYEQLAKVTESLGSVSV